MSGVTEWKNAVFLWVNVGEGGSYANLFERSLPAAVGGKRDTDIASEDPPKCAVVGGQKTTQEPGNPQRKCTDIAGELAGACEEGSCTVDAGLAKLRMTWYAGGRMVPESPLIRRLLKCSETEESCEAADRNVASLAKSGEFKVERSASFKPQQGGEGSPRNTTKAKATATMTTAAVADVGPNGSTSAPLAQAHADIDPHKQARTDEKVPARFAAAVAESAAGEPAVVNVARADAADQPVRRSSNKCKDAVLLFCRLPKKPYVFCGRLGYAEHWSAERPLRFVWRLLDAGKLALQPDFGSIVEAAGIAGDGKKLEG